MYTETQFTTSTKETFPQDLRIINSLEGLTNEQVSKICNQISTLTIQANQNGHAVTPRTPDTIQKYIERRIMYVALAKSGEVGAAVRIDAEDLVDGGELVQLGTLVKNKDINIRGLAANLTKHVIAQHPDRLFIATSRPFAHKDPSTGKIIVVDYSGNALESAGLKKVTNWDHLAGIQAILCFQTCITCIDGSKALTGITSDGKVGCGVRSGITKAHSECSLYIPSAFQERDLEDLNTKIINNPAYLDEAGNFDINKLRRRHLFDQIKVL